MQMGMNVGKNVGKKSLGVMLLLVTTCVVGCSQQSRIDSWIKQIVATGNKEKAAIKAQGWKDCKIYRDGEKNGVVYEYIGAPAQDAQLKMTDENLLKTEVKQLLQKNLTSNPQTKRAIKGGVYLRFLYKTSTGETTADLTFTGDDFK